MKKLEKIVPSRKLCQEMQDLGIDFGKTFFSWIEHRDGEWYVEISNSDKCDIINGTNIPAPVTDEMMRLLVKKRVKIRIITGKENIVETLSNSFISEGNAFLIKEENLIQALAKLCIWCKQEGYL